MHYEEKLIDGILHFRTDVNGTWYIKPKTITLSITEYEQIKKDAERYNWLRTQCSYIIGYGLGWPSIPHQDDKLPFDYNIDQSISEDKHNG
jgi:hypothetical protein